MRHGWLRPLAGWHVAVVNQGLLTASNQRYGVKSAGTPARGLNPYFRDELFPTNFRVLSLVRIYTGPTKTDGHLIKHAPYYWLLLAESHLTRRLFGAMLCGIAAPPSPAG